MGKLNKKIKRGIKVLMKDVMICVLGLLTILYILYFDKNNRLKH